MEVAFGFSCFSDSPEHPTEDQVMKWPQTVPVGVTRDTDWVEQCRLGDKLSIVIAIRFDLEQQPGSTRQLHFG